SALVPGIEPSEDKLLQGRLFSYPDTQRHRLGPNYLQIPVNCPFARVRNHQRDGYMTVKQDTSPVNYEPNSHAGAYVEAGEAYAESESVIEGTTLRRSIDKTNNFGQAGEKYREMSPEEQDRLVHNLVNDLKQVRPEVQMRALCNFFRADAEYGAKLAAGLGVEISEYLQHGSRS
ncbi:catalase, partial [Paenibacillus thiaminolyticus]